MRASREVRRTVWRPWGSAMDEALYGAAGFYRRPEGPPGHFRTAAGPGPHLPAFAAAITRLAGEVAALLGNPATVDLVDLGAGHGDLLSAVHEQLGSQGDGNRWRLTGVELTPRPPGLPAAVGWQVRPPERIRGLVLAHEWLDNVPVDVAAGTPDGPRLVLVDQAGRERLGPPVSSRDGAWLQAWWPLRPGQRAEIGRSRDDAWAGVIAQLDRGVAVAIDYSHDRAARPVVGTLAGHRRGRRVLPVPDGSCDLTAHVALDSCAVAGARAGATGTAVIGQAAALRALGLSTRRPATSVAAGDPAAYAEALARATAVAELVEPDGLGAFAWLIQAKGCDGSAAASLLTGGDAAHW